MRDSIRIADHPRESRLPLPHKLICELDFRRKFDLPRMSQDVGFLSLQTYTEQKQDG